MVPVAYLSTHVIYRFQLLAELSSNMHQTKRPGKIDNPIYNATRSPNVLVQFYSQPKRYIELERPQCTRKYFQANIVA